MNDLSLLIDILIDVNTFRFTNRLLKKESRNGRLSIQIIDELLIMKFRFIL